MTAKIKFTILVVFTGLMCACASGAKENSAPPPSSPAAHPPSPATTAEKPTQTVKPAIVETKPSAPAAAAPKSETKAEEPPKPKAPQTWRLKKGKLSGPNAFVAGKQISKVKNDKTPGFTTETCYNYGNFAVVEMRSTDEVGAAEISVRHADPAAKANLCATEYKGRTDNLRIIEGYFSGIAGEYLVVEGADATEGLIDFQIFKLETGKEVFKAKHDAGQEFSIAEHGDGKDASLLFFGKLDVKCELAQEGEPCWKETLKLNKVQKPTPMPPCKAEFEKRKIALTEPALAATLARVSRLAAPKVQFIGGHATCLPEP